VYCKSSLWGNTFCQAFTVGLASYHFISEEEGAYISYEHPSTGQWPNLDNGMPIPPRVPFHGIRVEGHTFYGTIQWQHDYATTWQRMASWEYEIHFDSEFACVLSGRVKSFSSDTSEAIELSRFGENLNYTNAGLHRMSQSALTSTVSAADDVTRMIQRLQDEGASSRTMWMINRMALVALEQIDNLVNSHS
jgi:hypothetical protein